MNQAASCAVTRWHSKDLSAMEVLFFYQRTVALQFVLVSTVQQRVHVCMCMHMCVSICVYMHPLPLGPPSHRHPSPLGRHRALGSAPSARQQLPTGCLSHARECVCVLTLLSPSAPPSPSTAATTCTGASVRQGNHHPKKILCWSQDTFGARRDLPGFYHCRSPLLPEDEEGACDRFLHRGRPETSRLVDWDYISGEGQNCS